LGPQDGSSEPPAQGYYHKQRLVPFGEYIPLEQWFRGAIDFFDLPMSAFKIPTEEQGLLTHSPVPIAGNICYEIAYPQLVAKQAAAAQMIVTVSNDTWFEHSLAPWQHLQIAQMRAIENAKPVARATNSGVSALIDAKGHITALAPMYQPAQLTGLVEPKQGTTPYNWGLNWPITLLSLGLVLFGFCRNFTGFFPHRLKP
jgi:apolipoprotein N-acyltransferase